MKKFLKTMAVLLGVGVVGIGATACSFDFEQPEWMQQALCDHVFDEEILLSDATCEDAGELMKICTDCGKTKTVAIKKLPHVDEDGDNRCDACDRKIAIDKDEATTFSEVKVENGDFLKSGWYRIYEIDDDLTVGTLKDEDGEAAFHIMTHYGQTADFFHSLTAVSIKNEFEMVYGETDDGARYTDINIEIPKEVSFSGGPGDTFTYTMTSGWTWFEVSSIYYLDGK